jgi:hypothetical protein
LGRYVPLMALPRQFWGSVMPETRGHDCCFHCHTASALKLTAARVVVGVLDATSEQYVGRSGCHNINGKTRNGVYLKYRDGQKT